MRVLPCLGNISIPGYRRAELETPIPFLQTAHRRGEEIDAGHDVLLMAHLDDLMNVTGRHRNRSRD